MQSEVIQKRMTRILALLAFVLLIFIVHLFYRYSDMSLGYIVSGIFPYVLILLPTALIHSRKDRSFMYILGSHLAALLIYLVVVALLVLFPEDITVHAFLVIGQIFLLFGIPISLIFHLLANKRPK